MVPGIRRGSQNRRTYWAYLFARLKPGVSIEEARAAMNVQYSAILNDVEASLQTGMSDQTLARFRKRTIGVEPGGRGQSSVHREAPRAAALLLGVTALVLIIACANIANLLLARSAARAGEMAVRLSHRRDAPAADAAAPHRVLPAGALWRRRRTRRCRGGRCSHRVDAAARAGAR